MGRNLSHKLILCVRNKFIYKQSNHLTSVFIPGMISYSQQEITSTTTNGGNKYFALSKKANWGFGNTYFGVVPIQCQWILKYPITQSHRRFSTYQICQYFTYKQRFISPIVPGVLTEADVVYKLYRVKES